MTTDSALRQQAALEQITVSQRPMLFFALAAVSVFVAETALMFALPSDLPVWQHALIDSVLLMALTLPMLYLFILRPMKLHLKELFRVQALLEQQVAERREAEAALRHSEKQLRYLSSELLKGHEQEKRRLAYELHEELGQSLAALKILLKLLTRSIPPTDPDVQEECRNGMKQIDDMINKIRRLTRALSPAILEDLGLSAALRRLIVTSAQETAIECSVEIPDIDEKLPKKNQILLYRFLQEALSNIATHSEASTHSVVIDDREGFLSIVIADNGKGFDAGVMADPQDTRRGIGLAVMKERARMLGGSFDLWTQRGEGTRITLTIPTKAENRAHSVAT